MVRWGWNYESNSVRVPYWKAAYGFRCVKISTSVPADIQ